MWNYQELHDSLVRVIEEYKIDDELDLPKDTIAQALQRQLLELHKISSQIRVDVQSEPKPEPTLESIREAEFRKIAPNY